MNSILSCYRLHEWVWARWLKANAPRYLSGNLIKSKSDFVAWLEINCPYFGLLQELANGSKHCSPVHSTDKIEGYGMGPYGIGPFGTSYLLIDLGDNRSPSERYLVANEILGEIVEFWERLFSEEGIA